MPMLLSALGEAREPVVASGLTLSDWITAGAVLAAGLTASQIVNRALHRAMNKGDSGVEGTVEAVSWRTVELRTFDGERAFVPCAEVLSTPVINYTAMGKRRTTLCLEVGYEVDLEQARDVLLSTVKAVPGVLQSPEPEVWLEQFSDSGVKFALRFWHAPDAETFWRTRSEVGMAARHALAEAGIEISGPEMTLRFR